LWTHQLSATDADSANLSYSLSGPVPAGLVVDPDHGWLRWLPGDSAGSATYNFTATVTDPGGLSDSIPVSITIDDRSGPPASHTCIRPETIIATGSSWLWAVGESGAAWKEPWFDSSTWGSGPAILGFGEADVVTTTAIGNIRTTLVKTFTVTDANAVNSLTLHLMRDDAAIVYLNGVEVVRDNLPAGTITESTTASASVFGGAERAFNSFTIPTSQLAEGVNTIAVGLHQVAANSNDMRFDLRLESTRLVNCIPAPVIDPMNLFFHGQLSWNTLPGTVYTVEICDDLTVGGWQDLQTLTATTTTAQIPISFPNRRKFYRIRIDP